MTSEYQRYGRNKSSAVNKAYINSGEYRNKFDSLTDNKAVSRVLYAKAKEMLLHRGGTMIEDMYWIDGETGEITASALDEKNESSVIYPKSLIRTLENKTNLIAMHTHPHSMPPSIPDINSACRFKYLLGLIICHDGTIYAYKSRQIISEELHNAYIRRYVQDGFSEKEAQFKSLEKLKESYGFDFWEVK